MSGKGVHEGASFFAVGHQRCGHVQPVGAHLVCQVVVHDGKTRCGFSYVMTGSKEHGGFASELVTLRPGVPTHRFGHDVAACGGEPVVPDFRCRFACVLEMLVQRQPFEPPLSGEIDTLTVHTELTARIRFGPHGEGRVSQTRRISIHVMNKGGARVVGDHAISMRMV